jgi:hypothetical protein
MGSDTPRRQTLRQSVADAVGDDHVVAICHRELLGTLADPTFVWNEYTSLSALPERPLDGWEELLVFTDTDVYHWVETGYANGPTVLPRGPASVSPHPSFAVE